MGRLPWPTFLITGWYNDYPEMDRLGRMKGLGPPGANKADPIGPIVADRTGAYKVDRGRLGPVLYRICAHYVREIIENN